MTSRVDRYAAGAFSLTGLVVVVLWPSGDIAHAVTTGTIARLVEVLARVTPAVVIIGGVSSALPAQEEATASGARLLFGVLGDALSLATAVIVPIAAAVGIARLPLSVLVSVWALLAATSFSAHLFARTARRLLHGAFQQRSVTSILVLGWLVGATLYAPQLNPFTVGSRVLALDPGGFGLVIPIVIAAGMCAVPALAVTTAAARWRKKKTDGAVR